MDNMKEGFGRGPRLLKGETEESGKWNGVGRRWQGGGMAIGMTQVGVTEGGFVWVTYV